MTEKNIFAYKLFLSLDISDFNLFFMWKLDPSEKSHPLFPSNPLLRVEFLLSPPFWKFGWRFNPPQQKGGGGAHCDSFNRPVLFSKPKWLNRYILPGLLNAVLSRISFSSAFSAFLFCVCLCWSTYLLSQISRWLIDFCCYVANNITKLHFDSSDTFCKLDVKILAASNKIICVLLSTAISS